MPTRPLSITVDRRLAKETLRTLKFRIEVERTRERNNKKAECYGAALEHSAHRRGLVEGYEALKKLLGP